MTQYLLSVWSREGETPLTDEEIQQSYADTGAFNEQVRKEGAWVFAGGLHPSSTATVVDGRGEEPVTTDGPFAESKEMISYAVYETSTKQEAVEWTSRFLRLHLDLWPGWVGEARVLKVFGPEDMPSSDTHGSPQS